MQEDHRISRRAAKALASPGASLFVSVISIWEILIKRHAGKLLTTLTPEAIVFGIRSQTVWRILPLEIEHIEALNDIARFSDHTDPFDRMLIAQAKSERLKVIAADQQFSRYKLDVVW
jgi:PIN domain nuclease of toxin-antitoxin system